MSKIRTPFHVVPGDDELPEMAGASVSYDDTEFLQIEAYHVIKDCRTVAMQLDIRYDYMTWNGLCDELVGDTVTITDPRDIKFLRDRLDKVIPLVIDHHDGPRSEWELRRMSVVLLDVPSVLIVLQCDPCSDTFSVHIHYVSHALGVPTLDPLVSEEPYAMTVEDPDGTVLTEFLTAWRDECDKCLEARL